MRPRWKRRGLFRRRRGGSVVKDRVVERASAPLREKRWWEALAERPGLRPDEKKVSTVSTKAERSARKALPRARGYPSLLTSSPSARGGQRQRRLPAGPDGYWITAPRRLDVAAPSARVPIPEETGRGPLPSAPAAASVRRPSEPPGATGRGGVSHGVFLRLGNDADGRGMPCRVRELAFVICMAGGGLPALSPSCSLGELGGGGGSG